MLSLLRDMYTNDDVVLLFLDSNRYSQIKGSTEFGPQLTGRSIGELQEQARQLRRWFCASLQRNGDSSPDRKTWGWLLDVV